MMDASKYRVGYFPADKKYNQWAEKDHIEKPPVWCSVDMQQSGILVWIYAGFARMLPPGTHP